MRDQLVGIFPEKKECLVLNIDRSSNDGTHWTCLFVSDNKCLYFDSYGFPPPIEVLEYFRNVKNRYYNTFRVQNLDGGKASGALQASPAERCSALRKLDAVGCGHYCIYVLYKLSDGYLRDPDQRYKERSSRDLVANFYNILDELYRTCK